jgi:hypothetical protein
MDLDPNTCTSYENYNTLPNLSVSFSSSIKQKVYNTISDRVDFNIGGAWNMVRHSVDGCHLQERQGRIINRTQFSTNIWSLWNQETQGKFHTADSFFQAHIILCVVLLSPQLDLLFWNIHVLTAHCPPYSCMSELMCLQLLENFWLRGIEVWQFQPCGLCTVCAIDQRD